MTPVRSPVLSIVWTIVWTTVATVVLSVVAAARILAALRVAVARSLLASAVRRSRGTLFRSTRFSTSARVSALPAIWTATVTATATATVALAAATILVSSSTAATVTAVRRTRGVSATRRRHGRRIVGLVRIRPVRIAAPGAPATLATTTRLVAQVVAAGHVELFAVRHHVLTNRRAHFRAPCADAENAAAWVMENVDLHLVAAYPELIESDLNRFVDA